MLTYSTINLSVNSISCDTYSSKIKRTPHMKPTHSWKYNHYGARMRISERLRTLKLWTVGSVNKRSSACSANGLETVNILTYRASA